ncbi:MAG: HAMP domain-containing histidine kinase [Anaerolineae bacterium]|nr:HAMP domain-containing histidine kinase [Anaerolineae bacterium]MCB9107995.1 HAMP domain-containing histidine kinase [Anaerolineales bacterium]
MKLWRKLRWRIFGSHLIVVVTGVACLLLTTEIIISNRTLSAIQPRLAALTQAKDPVDVEMALAALQETYHNTLLFSLIIAALGATLAGAVTSLLLTTGIIRPLQQIALSSRRIAGGQYAERVEISDIEELDSVATNFNQMAAALEQVEQQRVALIGNVSHELRTPLTGIEGYLQGMMDGLMPSDAQTFAQMYQEVRRLRRLVDDLQALSRVEAGQIPLHLETFDLAPVVERVIKQLQPQAMAQSLSISTNCSGILSVYADPDRTAQVLVNLMGNAIRYTPEGGDIKVTVKATPKFVEIAVQDSGQGIPPEALPYIFERFYRVDQSRSRSSGGSGIGLTISRHLAWAMGGELIATSEGEGQGSTFYFHLPKAK